MIARIHRDDVELRCCGVMPRWDNDSNIPARRRRARTHHPHRVMVNSTTMRNTPNATPDPARPGLSWLR
eukprot:scaffold274399_cov37-Tisochrysis_lutea.AAC.5